MKTHHYTTFAVSLLLWVLLPSLLLATPCKQATREQLLKKAQPYDGLITQSSRRYHVDANLLRAVIAIESCYNPDAVSSAGARGLMQIMPDTAKRFGVDVAKSDQPVLNIQTGTRYLRFLQQRYKGELEKVLAAYNAGEGKVDRHQGIPPYKETRLYVKNVIQAYNTLRGTPLSAKQWGKPGRQGLAALKLRAPHLFKKGTVSLQVVEK